MAELYLAKDTRNSRLLVLKRILPYLAEEVEFVRMFLDEARIASQLHHANIVEVYELGKLDDSIFIAMEFVDGVDLRKVLQQAQARSEVIPPGIAAWLVARLCEGLHYAHMRDGPDGRRLGIIHRDVSPQNLMVNYDGDVKLVDFGIAKATAWMSRSKPGVIKGKFLYLAPEQLTQEVLDHRADLFAVGTLLYELTTGKSPFYRQTTEAVIYSIRMEEPPPPHTVRPGYPQGLSRIVMRCLEKDRGRRYATGEDVRRALDGFLASEAPTTRHDVAHYIASLFGAEEERTGIFIPPNAQTNADVAPVPPPREARDTSAERPMRDSQDDSSESTRPIRPSAIAARLAEGKRPTGEFTASGESGAPEVTNKLKPRDLSMTAPLDQVPDKLQNQPANPFADDDRTSMLPDAKAPPPAWQRAGGEEGESTVLITDSQRTAPLDPDADVTSKAHARRDEPVSELSDLGPPLTPPTRPAPMAMPAQRPGPPVPSRKFEPLASMPAPRAGQPAVAAPPVQAMTRVAPPDDDEPESPAPSHSELSAPMVFSGIVDLDEVEATVDELKAVPPPKTRPRPRPRPRPGVLADPDDLINTVEQRNPSLDEMSFTEPGTSRRLLMFAGLGAAVVLLLLLVVWAFWPSTPPPPTPIPQPERRARLAPTPDGAQPPAETVKSTLIPVEIRAPKGTLLEVAGRETAAKLKVPPGALTITYRCPVKRRKASVRQSFTVEITAESPQPVVVAVPCR